MWLKILIVILFIANIVALGAAFMALLQDQGQGGKRTARLLLVRVSLGALLFAAVLFGLVTGELGLSVPWLGRYNS